MDCFQRAAGKHFIELSEHKYSCDDDVDDDDDDDDDEIGNNYWIRPETHPKEMTNLRIWKYVLTETSIKV